MQQVLLNIENKELETKLLEEANKRGRKLASIIIDILEKKFLPKKERKLNFKKLDPLKHISKIEYEVDENDDLTGVFPFEDVDNSAVYISELRKNTWRK
jgi:hypothetical protein